MKTKHKKSIEWISLLGISTVALILTIFQGCTDSTAPALKSELTEADVQAATEIMGTALADETDGVIATMYDASAAVGPGGMLFGPFRSRTQAESTFTNGPNGSNGEYGPFNPNSGRKSEHEFEYSYDPETGIHSIHFKRVIDNKRLEKTMEADLEYIFRDADENFIVHPLLNADAIETTDYKGVRSGTHETFRRYAEFMRKDTLYLTGMSDVSDILGITGNHSGNGSMELARPDSTIERRYELYISLNDIQVDKAVVEASGSLEEGVSGTMDYNLVIWRSNGVDETEKTISGTIELDGDGTALMRIKRLARYFNLNLLDGTVAEAPGSNGNYHSGQSHNGQNGNNGNGGNGGSGGNGGNGGSN